MYYFDGYVTVYLFIVQSNVFNNHVLQNLEGERVARISYSSLHSVNIGTKTARERQQKRGSCGEDIWDILRRHLRWMQMEKYPRFSHTVVKRQIARLQKDSNKVSVWSVVICQTWNRGVWYMSESQSSWKLSTLMLKATIFWYRLVEFVP